MLTWHPSSHLPSYLIIMLSCRVVFNVVVSDVQMRAIGSLSHVPSTHHVLPAEVLNDSVAQDFLPSDKSIMLEPRLGEADVGGLDVAYSKHAVLIHASDALE